MLNAKRGPELELQCYFNERCSFFVCFSYLSEIQKLFRKMLLNN